MKTEWDYTDLADAYIKRPDYSDDAINQLIKLCNLKSDAKICDVGAGVAHLTIKLAEKGYHVEAVEPNDAMRKNGIKRTEQFEYVSWAEGTGENTGKSENLFELVTFGSSFNVTDRQIALKETIRILKPRGWFACMWNHRDLEDPIQKSIEDIISKNIKGYNYGSRREDQTDVINQSGLFGEVFQFDGKVIHEQSKEDCHEAWASHATLQRQAGDAFGNIVSQIKEYLDTLPGAIKIPYTTRIWAAQAK